MADSSVSVKDAAGATVPVDAQSVGTDYQQTVTLGDGANAGRVAALTAQGGLQVNIGQSGSLNAGASGALTAAGLSTLAGATSTSGAIVLDVSNAGNASFHLLAAAFVGTVVFEQSFDPAGANGTWAGVPATAEDGPNTPISQAVVNGAYLRQFTTPMFGPALFRVRCSAFTSGSLAVLARAGAGWYENAMVQARGGTPTVTNVTSSASSGTILAANGNRLMAAITNDSTSILYLNESGAAASATAWSQRLQPGQQYELPHPVHTSAITGIWATANGFARVVEW